MFGMITFLYYRLKARMRSQYAICRDKTKSFGQNASTYSNSLHKYAGRKFLDSEAANNRIKNLIESGRPFMAARYGATEILNMRTFDFKYESEEKKKFRFQQLSKWSGFFPNDTSLGGIFTSLMKEASKQVDVIAVWYNAFEDYYIERYTPKSTECTYLTSLEPWTNSITHWSSALNGKKVLVIHPFADTIWCQYKKRNELFPGTDILPEFELITLKAVQTIAGEKDERFNDWFEALEWMYQQAMAIDFDIAILGCGAYGFPLAAKLKKAGKQAIHLGGVTQIMFGIKGKRWDEQEEYKYIRDLYNDAWVYPSSSERPNSAKIVENGCYW